MVPRPLLILTFVAIGAAFLYSTSADRCPDNRDCPEACCPSNAPNQYYCCQRGNDQDRVYVVGLGSFWKDYWGLFLGLFIAGLIISIILSVLCCLYCNGCFWHRRRHPDLYAGSFPLGTIIYSPYCGPPPHPQHHPPSYYDDVSPDSSVRSGTSAGLGGNRKGVRFDRDTMVKGFDNAPKSAMKKPNGHVNGRNSPPLLL